MVATIGVATVVIIVNRSHAFGGKFAPTTSQTLKTLPPDGIIEREKPVALKLYQALVTYLNHQPTLKDAKRTDFEDPYLYQQNGTEAECVLQAWTLTCDNRFEDKCKKTGIALTRVDDPGLKSRFENARKFCGGGTPEDCVAEARERSEHLRRVAKHVYHGELGPVMFCALKTEVTSPVFVGSVSKVLRFLGSPDVQKCLRIRSVDLANATVISESLDDAGRVRANPQQFRFSTVSNDQRLVVYKRRGRRIFCCVKLEEQFLKEGEYLPSVE